MKVNFAALEGLSGDIGARSNAIQSLLDDLHGQIEKLQATWEGSASGAFLDQKNKWEGAATDLTAVLAKIGVAVRTINDAYGDTERSNAARFGG